MKLKNSVITRIQENLETENFCKDDFELTLPDSRGALIRITFKPYPEYNLEIFESTKRVTKKDTSMFAVLSDSSYEIEEDIILTIERPGDYKITESNQFSNLEAALDRLRAWTNNIRQELIQNTSSQNDDFFEEELRFFQEKVEVEIDNPLERFNDSEIEDLTDKLENLKKRIEQLESQIGEDGELAPEAERTIEKTKADLKIYPRGIWYKTAGNKLLNLMKSIMKTQEGRQLIAETIRGLLK